jgi:hypothetical protein
MPSEMPAVLRGEVHLAEVDTDDDRVRQVLAQPVAESSHQPVTG